MYNSDIITSQILKEMRAESCFRFLIRRRVSNRVSDYQRMPGVVCYYADHSTSDPWSFRSF